MTAMLNDSTGGAGMTDAAGMASFSYVGANAGLGVICRPAPAAVADLARLDGRIVLGCNRGQLAGFEVGPTAPTATGRQSLKNSIENCRNVKSSTRKLRAGSERLLKSETRRGALL